MLSQIVFIALISYIIVQRVRVTRLSKQNMAKVLAEGGKLHTINYNNGNCKPIKILSCIPYQEDISLSINIRRKL